MRTMAFVLVATLARAGAQEELGWEALEPLLSAHQGTFDEALERVRDSGDVPLMAGLNDLLYLQFVTRQRERAEAIAEVMEEISGEEIEMENARRGWAEWVGRHEEVAPREGYVLFKRTVFETYDPAFRGYLNPRFTYRIRVEEIEWGGVRKDGIPALDEPGFVPAGDAGYLGNDERVFGVFLNGEAKAYPHRILDAHEMANDVVGGRHVSLSYCTLCGSGILYDGEHPSRDGKAPFTFGSSGLLYRSNKLMYDRPTNSLWNNLTGQPVAGRLAESGIELMKLPLVVTTWGEWKRRHPQSLVLDVENTGFDRDYSKSPYEAYFASEETMFPVWLQSNALDAKSWVFALIVNGGPKAYPIEVLKEEGVTHDRLGGEDVVLVTDRESGAVRAYSAEGRRFSATGDPARLRDDSGAEWSVEEDFLSGPGGEKLPRLAGHNAFWFGWYAFYPTTEIYEPTRR